MSSDLYRRMVGLVLRIARYGDLDDGDYRTVQEALDVLYEAMHQHMAPPKHDIPSEPPSTSVHIFAGDTAWEDTKRTIRAFAAHMNDMQKIDTPHEQQEPAK